MKNYKTLILLFLIVIVLQVLSAVAIKSNFVNWSERGSFGDMFGAINTLFSGLAFAGVIFAIILQSEELKLQRKELRQSREQFEISNSLTKMELLNQFYLRYDSEYFRISRKEAAKLLLSKKKIPVNDLNATRSLDEVLNFLQELGIAQKNGILDIKFVAARFGGLARCYYYGAFNYIQEVREKEGDDTWESVAELIKKSSDTVKISIDDQQVQAFLLRESKL